MRERVRRRRGGEKGEGEEGEVRGYGESEGEVRVRCVIFIQNGHIYKYGHKWNRKCVSRHDSVGIRREIDEKKDEIPPGFCKPRLLENIQYWEFEG